MTSSQFFISYSRKNRDIAQQVANAMTRRGYSIWLDEHIPGGADWHKTITKHLREADFFIVILTEDAVESQWVKDEILLAREAGKHIIPLRFEDIRTPDVLVSYQYIDFVGREFGDAFADVVRTIAGYMPGHFSGASKPLVSAGADKSKFKPFQGLSKETRVMAYLTLLGIIVSCGVTLIAAVIQILPDILPTSLPVFQTDGAKTVVVEAPIPTLIVENTVFSTEPIAFSTEPIAPASPASSTSTVGASSSLTTGAAPTTATDAPTPTHTLEPLPAIILFPEPQSFTIYVASDQPISLTELELLVTIEGALRTIHPAEDFDILQLLAGEAQTGACFRYLSPGASVPLPSECADRQNVFDRQVARPDVFWHDAATGTIRTLLVRWGKVTASCATARCPIQPLEGS